MLWDLMPRDESKYRQIVIDLARKATVLRPHFIKNWENLASLLLGRGEYEEAIAVLAEAVSTFPTEPRLYLTLADTYRRVQRMDLAQEVLQRTPAIPIDDREMTIYYLELHLELLMRRKAVQDAVQVAIDALALDPMSTRALKVLGTLSRKNGNPEIMLPICQTVLKHEPGHTLARYELALAHTILGGFEEARRLIDLGRFITVTEVITPHGYENAARFEAALAREIICDPTLKSDVPHLATRGGLQTMAGLPHAGERAISDVIALIRLAVDAFEANLTKELDHPFIKRRPKRAWLNAWAVVYPGHGRQVAHIHEEGWLSGVYYVSAPKTCEDVRDGCLVLGAIEEGLNVDPPWGIRYIRPAPGRLVLFPSYIPHATIPTGSTDKRICIAFDVEGRSA
jgi:tetratricopeptide (TPR) repeat protein